MNIVCFGDSITHGAEFTVADRWPSILARLLEEWQPGSFAVYNRGIGGHTSRQGVERFAQDVAPLLPAMVLVQFGLNDANVYDWTVEPRVGLEEFEQNLRTIHRRVVDGGGSCVFVLNHSLGPVTGWQGNDRSYNENVEPYNPTIRRMALALQAPFIDLPGAMQARGIAAGDFVVSDGMHLKRSANLLYAEMVFEELSGLLDQPQPQPQAMAAAQQAR